MSEGYVLDLRKILGPRPLVVACASIIIYNEDGILLHRRYLGTIMSPCCGKTL